MSAPTKDETYAWRVAHDLTLRSPVFGIAACWARARWQHAHPGYVDTVWDDSLCRDLRGAMAFHAWRLLPVMGVTP